MKFSELQRLQRREGITVLSADERIEQLEARLRTITKERDALRAKVAEMEQQAPAYWGPKHAIEGGSTTVIVGKFPVNPTDTPLYALPGAQPAPSVPDEWREGVESAARLIDLKADLYSTRFGHDDMGVLSFGTGTHAEIKMAHYTGLLELADEVRAMLAAAPEAKP